VYAGEGRELYRCVCEREKGGSESQCFFLSHTHCLCAVKERKMIQKVGGERGESVCV